MGFYSNGIEGSDTTTNATPTELARRTIDENVSAVATVAIGAVSTGGVHASWSITANIKRDTGNVSVLGSVTNLLTPGKDIGALLWDVDLDVDGADLVLTVTGATGVTIDWAGFGPISGVQAD